MCGKPKMPKPPPPVVAPPAPQKVATEVGDSEAEKQSGLTPGSLRRFTLRFPPNFTIPS
jgi:hypothetical protein